MSLYGFTWGPVTVTRLAHLKIGKRESYVTEVATSKHRVEVYASRTGRSLRVWRDGKELT
jgi:hypothetical protein